MKPGDVDLRPRRACPLARIRRRSRTSPFVDREAGQGEVERGRATNRRSAGLVKHLSASRVLFGGSDKIAREDACVRRY
jgi:hypothetical protein